MKSDALLDELLDSPKLVLYFNELQNILQRESERRKEFYATFIDNEKVEFINGKIVFYSPVSIGYNKDNLLLLRLISVFVDKYDLGYVAHGKIIISLTRNDYEPDICFFSKSKSSQFSPGQTQFPAPDLIVETLTDSTEKRTKEIKIADYAAHKVTEYWLINPEEQAIEQYILQGDRYQLKTKSTSGNLHSLAIANLEFPVRAIFDIAENLNALQSILLSSSD
jgi:Uma2 family endonuclease